MAYSGGAHSWSGHDPPNPNNYPPPSSNPQYQLSQTSSSNINISNDTQHRQQHHLYQPALAVNQQYWNQNAQVPQHSRGVPFQQPAVNGHHSQYQAHSFPPNQQPPAPTRSQYSPQAQYPTQAPPPAPVRLQHSPHSYTPYQVSQPAAIRSESPHQSAYPLQVRSQPYSQPLYQITPQAPRPVVPPPALSQATPTSPRPARSRSPSQAARACQTLPPPQTRCQPSQAVTTSQTDPHPTIQPQPQAVPTNQAVSPSSPVQPKLLSQAVPNAQPFLSLPPKHPQAQAQAHTQAHTQAQPQVHPQQPLFISPAQLLQQPPQTQSMPQYMSPQHLFQSRSAAPNTSARMAPIQTPKAQIDHPKLLMSLAEEFFDAAHELGPTAAMTRTFSDVNTYGKLIATGLGCLDSALKNVKLPPRLEATIRLRYAGVLYEETENFMEAETALSKGIALCEQNHYFDIKYAMQFLLAQLMFKKSPKAALKALDGYTLEASTLRHCSWVYAFRFLRASYSAELDSATDTNAAIHNLREVAKLSGDQQDRAIYLTASLLECMVHLRCGSPDSIEQAQRALASALKYQLDTHSQIRPLTGLAHILDVVCSIKQGNPQVMSNRMKELQALIDGSLHDPSWGTTDIIAIPIDGRTSSQVVSPDTRAVVGIGDDGRDTLMLQFLNIKDTYSLTCLLAAIVVKHRNPTDQVARKYLKAGVVHLEENIRANQDASGLLSECVAKSQWRGQMLCYFHVYLAFCAAELSEWATMKSSLDKLQATTISLGVSSTGLLGFFVLYLGGVYHQGVGDLDAALDVFHSSRFDLSRFQSASLNATGQCMRDISILAALNSLWILQHPERQDVYKNTMLMTKMEEICENHPSKDIKTAYSLVVATVGVIPPAPLHKIKKYLGDSLTGAKATGNTQFFCFTLNMMCSKFFSNVVGEQAEKSAMAGSLQAKKSGNSLWMSVADGMLAQCYDVNGKKEKSAKTYEQACVMAMKALPNAQGNFN